MTNKEKYNELIAKSPYHTVIGDIQHLCEHATIATKKAKCHISNYRVGAAIMDKDGDIFTGFNIEFDIHSTTIHAEQLALAHYLGSEQLKPVDMICVCTPQLWFPCGLCRQCLYEYLGGDCIIIATDGKQDDDGYFNINFKTLGELLPAGFRKEKL